MLAELEQARLAWTRMSRNLTEKRKAGRRTCSKCKKLKGPDGFYAGKYRTWCKRCDNAARRVWREANRARDNETTNRYRARKRAERAA